MLWQISTISHHLVPGLRLLLTIHTYLVASQPFCSQIPDAILNIVASEPTGEIAEMYRGYVRHTLMPLMQRVADMLREYSAYMELPPKGWLEQKFPGMPWKVRRSP